MSWFTRGGVLLVCAVALLSSSSGAVATGSPDPNADTIRQGLADFTDSLKKLTSSQLESLAAKVPFTDVAPTGTDGLNLDSVLNALKTQLQSGSTSSLDDLNALLNDPDGNGDTANDGTLLGGTVDLQGTVSQAGSVYDVALTLTITRSDTTPIDIEHSLVTVSGGSLGLGFNLNGVLHLQFDNSKPAGEKLYLLAGENPSVSLGVDADADFSTSPFNINLGIAEVQVGGTADTALQFNAPFSDPDGNGHITSAEFTTSAAEVLFQGLNCGASHVNLDLALTSSISGLGGAQADIDLADATPCSGVDTPTVNLNALGDFKSMTPTDMLSAIAQLASLLQSVVNVGPAGLNIPFLHERLGDVAKLNEKLVKFFTDNGLSAQPPESGDDCAGASGATPADVTDDDDDGFINDGCPAVGAPETGAQCMNATDDDTDDFVNDGCPATTNNPLDLNLTAGALEGVDTIDEVIPKVEDAFGLSPGALGLAYDPTSKQLTFHINSTGSATKAGSVDFSDQLEELGIVDVNSAGASASIAASYALDFTAGLDLTGYAESGTQCANATDDDADTFVNDGCPANLEAEATEATCSNATDDDADTFVNDGCPTQGPSLLDRVFVKTDGAEPEFKANFSTDADLQLDARIGFLGLTVEDSNATGSVPLVGKRASDSGDMIRINLSGGADNKLTASEVLDGLIDDDTDASDLTPTDIFGNLGDVVNVAVPEFTLNAEANVSGTPIVSGSIAVRWDDVLTGLPVITPQGNFNDELLSFDFDHSDPLALLSKIIDSLDTFVSSFEDLTGDTESLDTPLPIIGKSFKDLVDQIQTIKAQLEAIVADPSSTLQDFETQLEQLIGDALGIAPADQGGILEIEASTASPTQLTFRLGLGICSAEDPSDAARCDAIRPLSVPLNLDMGGEAISSLVGVSGSGAIALNYSAVANLNFRIKLPTVTPDDGATTDADSFPDVSGTPGLFLLDTSGIDLDANLDIATELSAHLGPLTVGVGETDVSPESGIQCDNGDDDDQDGYVNDGCAATDTAESGTQCDNAIDDAEDDPADTRINDGCPAKANPAIAKVGASFELANDVGSSGESEVDLSNASDVSDFFSGLVPSPFSITPDTPVTCPAVTSPSGDLAACARLPIFVGTNIAGVIKFGATDLLDPSTWDFDVPADLIDQIFANALDWSVLLDGLDTLLESLKVTLDGASYGVAIPGLGKSLEAGADIIAAFQDLVDQAQSFVDALDALSDPTAIQAALQTWLNDNLGSLLDGSSISVELLCDTGSGDAPCVAADPIQSITDALFKFSFGATAAEAHPRFDIGFPGLRLRATDDPGTVADERNLTASVDWRIDLAFGISKEDGFYLLTDRTPGDADTDPEISVEAGVQLPNNGSGPDLRGDIAFIRLNMEDNHPDPSGSDDPADFPDIDFGISANIKGGGSDKKLTLSDLTSGVDPTEFDVSLHGGVHINMHIDTTAEIPGFDQEGGLPSLGADFVLEWNFGAGVSIGTGSGLDASLSNDLDISFDNVTIDLGSFVDEFLGPIVVEIQRYLKPIQPVIDLVSAPIPGIAQLAKLIGATPPTMIDLFEAASGADLTFVKRVLALITFINSIPAGSSLGPIPLGDFDLFGAKVADRALPGNQVNELISSENLASGVDDAQGVLGEFGGGFQGALDTATGTGDQGGFEFPAFQHPTQLFRLLLGQDVTLIEWRSGLLKAEFTFSQNFGPIFVGPIPLSIVVSFSAGIQGQFGIGYDTFGIRKAVEALTDDDAGNNDAFNVVGSLFYGVFLDDLDSGGRDVPEIQLFAEGSVGVALDLVIVSAGIEGGIRATIDMNLHDGPWPPATSPGVVDGKIRIDEILSRIGNPICLFDVSGKLEAFIRAFVKIGIGPFSKKFDFTIVKITLLDLKNITAGICNVKPVLAKIDGGVLRVNIGPYAADRKLNVDDPKEKVTVRQLRPDGKKFSVTGFGLTQTFPEKGINPIPLTVFADGGTGNDSILMDKGGQGSDQGDGTTSTTSIDFTVNTVLCGGSGDDKIVGGNAHDEIQGDAGKGSGYTCSTAEAASDGSDELAGRDGDDTINGQGKNDEVAGEDGTDTLNAGTGNDSVTGGEGSDAITSGPNTLGAGQTDDDTVQGGPETNVNDGTTNDTINAGAGIDNVQGEAGNDTINGGPGDDNLIGSKNDDTINGNDGADVINGADGNDILNGNNGDDDIFGDLGNDIIDGGANNDDLIGGKDTGGALGDTINGGTGRDYILGDEGTIDRPAGQTNATSVDIGPAGGWPGNDTENGNSGNDVMYGQDGVDTMNGGTNDDDMFGGPGGDTMNGNENSDDMFGEAGMDTMHGNAGEDVMRGGADDDSMFGDEDHDDMNGDGGADTMQGNDAPDYMRGSVGNDNMQGNAGDDEMYGDADEDRMFGNGDEDLMFGNANHDYMEGYAEHDTMNGGAADDDMIGGTSTAGSSDTADTMNGDEGTDTMAGDNAQMTRNSPVAVVLLDLPIVGSPYPAAVSGDDVMHGNDAEDRMYGQSGDDTMFGDGADDYMEGNSGKDTMHGNDGLDDMLGGSGHDEGGPSGATRLLSDVDDESVAGEGDQMFGDGEVDFMAGDNANITRPSGQRLIALYNVDFAGSALSHLALAGNDTMHGGDSNDLMYGQADNDTMFGDAHQDYMEGNSGRDLMEGNAADDKMVGGSGQDNGGPAGAIRRLENAIDDNVPAATPLGQTGGDQMWGDGATPNLATDGIDYMSGDNSFITGLGAGRKIELYDVPFSATSIPGEVSGDDTMRGNGANDVMYGQGDEDRMFGDENDDYMEGNSAHDTMHGNADQDDMLGGSGKDDGGPGGTVRELRNMQDVGDDLFGDDAVDYIAGDNTRLDRGGTNHWDPAAAARQVTLYDVQTVGGTVIPQNVSGPDYMEGNGANDVMFGQGNGSQPATSGDPADGFDNDRDARESAASDPSVAGYDCADTADNDLDGLADATDPQCVAATDEDAAWDGDEMHGGNGDDYMEGNHGADWMFGEGNEDDMAGGGSEVPDADSRGVWPAAFTTPTMLKDGNDVMEGGPDDDAIAGDNAFFQRTQTATGFVHIAGGSGFDLIKRDAVMTHSPDPAGAFGNDYIRGNDGNDDEYGEQGADYIEGNDGQDAQVGDLGLIQNNIIAAGDGIADPGVDQFIRIDAPFIEDTIFESGSLHRLTTLYSAETGQGAEGEDVMLGNAGNDSMHGNGGADYMNGNGDYNPANVNSTSSIDGEDHLFGGDGPDSIWGGLGHDHIYGGHGDDHMDVIPRPYATTDKKGGPVIIAGDDPPLWFELARVGIDNFQGTDYIYGGFDKDEMQASYGRPGPRPGDRLIDWVGNTNIFYTCPGAYGEGVITRQHSPSMQQFLIDESFGDGAIDTANPASSGFRELGLIHPGEESGNPVFPGTPGHFTCPPMEIGLASASLSLSANPVKAGDTVTITATLHNSSQDVGDGATVVKFSANGREIGRGTIDGIDPGSSETVAFNWDTSGQSGVQTIEVQVDPDNLLAEGNESDNTASIDLQVGGTDLAVASSSVSLSKTKIVGNDRVTITGVVHNASDVLAKNITVRFGDNGAEVARTQVATLAAGASATVTATWRPRTGGAHTVVVTADPDAAIAELDESNNTGSVSVNVIANKAPNPTFDSTTASGLPDKWSANGADVSIVLDVLKATGNKGLKANGASSWISDPVPVTAAKLYGVAVEIMGGLAVVGIKEYTATGRALATASKSVAATTDGVFHDGFLAYTAGAEAAYVRIVLVGGVDSTPSEFDNVRFWLEP
ncbi:MAG: CARDB domain-containing protein [Gaiellaceae bacterium]